MNVKNQLEYYESKLNYETDPSDLFSALSEGRDVVVIDARQPHAYANEHIPTAINIPHRTMSEESTAMLDRTKLYVCYCDGIGCNASTKGALNLLRLGFQVKELIGGIEWWKKDGYATEGEHGQPGEAVSCGC